MGVPRLVKIVSRPITFLVFCFLCFVLEDSRLFAGKSWKGEYREGKTIAHAQLIKTFRGKPCKTKRGEGGGYGCGDYVFEKSNRNFLFSSFFPKCCKNSSLLPLRSPTVTLSSFVLNKNREISKYKVRNSFVPIKSCFINFFDEKKSSFLSNYSYINYGRCTFNQGVPTSCLYFLLKDASWIKNVTMKNGERAAMLCTSPNAFIFPSSPPSSSFVTRTSTMNSFVSQRQSEKPSTRFSFFLFPSFSNFLSSCFSAHSRLYFCPSASASSASSPLQRTVPFSSSSSSLFSSAPFSLFLCSRYNGNDNYTKDNNNDCNNNNRSRTRRHGYSCLPVFQLLKSSALNSTSKSKEEDHVASHEDKRKQEENEKEEKIENVSVILLAGGIGNRMKADRPKQYLLLKDKQVIEYSLNVFMNMNCVTSIIVVADLAYHPSISALVKNDSRLQFALAGKERQDSVKNGLMKILKHTSLVAIHDAARPCISTALVKNVLKDAMKYGAAVLGVPVKTTIKVSLDGGKFVHKTLDRATLWDIQTPQVIRPDLLLKGYEFIEKNDISVTDDASIVEALGVKVKLTMSDYTNLKITTPEDLDVATKHLENMQQQKQIQEQEQEKEKEKAKEREKEKKKEKEEKEERDKGNERVEEQSVKAAKVEEEEGYQEEKRVKEEEEEKPRNEKVQNKMRITSRRESNMLKQIKSHF